MAIQGMNLPSIAGVLGFKDFTNQLNNANAGVRNAVGLVNDWAKMAAQQNNAEKAAQAQRDFTAEQNQINRDFQHAQQDERFEHELGMFEKQQERQIANEKMKFNQGLQESLTTPISDKVDTNAMTEQRLRNKVIEMKQHPEWFGSDEEYQNAIAETTRRANEVMIANNDIKQTNKFQNEFKDLDKENFRNADDMLYWYSDNKDEIDRLDPSIESKVYNAVARKQAEQEDWNREQRGKKRSEARDSIDTADKLKKHNKKVNF
jgi:hypothetical protein